MHRFRSSDITNDKYIEAIERHGQAVIDHYKDMDIRELSEIIYHANLTENMYNNLMFALTLSDSFKLPTNQRQAAVLFFVLQVNYAYAQRETKIHITTVSQAHMYIEQSDGRFREILRENEPETVYTTFKCEPPKIPFVQFMWSIPTTHIMDGETKRQMINLAGAITAPYAMLSFPDIGVHNLQVPRMYYMQLFKDCFKTSENTVYFSNEKAIADWAKVAMTQDLFIQILSYCGFKHYYNIKRANCFETYYEFDGLVYAMAPALRNGIEDSQYLVLEDRDYDFTMADLQLEDKERVIEENRETIEELKTYWKKKAPNEYNFLSEAVQYLPIFDGEDWIEIWLAK